MARIIPKRTLEDIRFRNDIVEVIGSYFALKRAGSSFKAVCPFHREKTPSFHVNPQRQIFHCFGCGAGGDVFKFVMQYEGLDFVAAAKILAQRAGIRLELEEGDGGQGAKKDELYSIHEEIAQFYQRCLKQMQSADHARRYLEEREISEETVGEFLIGYAPDRWDSVIKWAEKKKHDIARVEEAGLVLKSTKENASLRHYDRFRNRLMFPIFDEQRRVIGFSGRLLEKDAKAAKYVNSPETPLFQKSRVLYGLARARRHIVESREAIVCEGQIDVIRCHQEGLCTAVAAQGTAFTADHAHILGRYADSVCIAFDSDKAGQDAAIRTAVVFMEAGLAVRIAILPKGEDPDSFICKESVDAFRGLVKNAVSTIGFQLGVLGDRENINTEVGTMRAAKAVLETIMHSPNAVQKAKLVQEAAKRLNVPASALQDDLTHLQKKRRGYQKSASFAKATEAKEPNRTKPKEEVALCEHVVHITDHPEIAELLETFLPLEKVSDPSCRAVISACRESAAKGTNLQDALQEFDDGSGEIQAFAAGLLMAPSKTRGSEWSREDAVRDLILTIWRRELKRERAELGESLKSKPDDVAADRHRQLTYDLRALKNWDAGSAVIEIELLED